MVPLDRALLSSMCVCSNHSAICNGLAAIGNANYDCLRGRLILILLLIITNVIVKINLHRIATRALFGKNVDACALHLRLY